LRPAVASERAYSRNLDRGVALQLIELGRIALMDKDRVYGTARNLGGKVEEGVGRVTGDATSWKLDQMAGTAQDLYGQTADAARETAGDLDKLLRKTIETQPYTTAIVALGIGWLLGRMRRPF
jgi:uncharacterized protein YjbJ (UPF0337 family)